MESRKITVDDYLNEEEFEKVTQQVIDLTAMEEEEQFEMPSPYATMIQLQREEDEEEKRPGDFARMRRRVEETIDIDISEDECDTEEVIAASRKLNAAKKTKGTNSIKKARKTKIEIQKAQIAEMREEIRQLEASRMLLNIQNKNLRKENAEQKIAFETYKIQHDNSIQDETIKHLTEINGKNQRLLIKIGARIQSCGVNRTPLPARDVVTSIENQILDLKAPCLGKFDQAEPGPTDCPICMQPFTQGQVTVSGTKEQCQKLHKICSPCYRLCYYQHGQTRGLCMVCRQPI